VQEEQQLRQDDASRSQRWQRRAFSREWRPFLLGGAATLVGIFALLLGAAPWVAEASFALAVLLGGWDIALTGIRQAIAARRLTVDLLMSIAAVGALLLGEYAEGAAVVLLFVLGERLEGITMERARRSIRSLMALAPDEATRLLPEGATEIVAVGELGIGDRLLVRPGERIAMDGLVVAGLSAVDQSPITGESIPVVREVGDEVFAGSINGQGALEMRVTRRAQDNTLARVIAMVEEAQSRRAPAQRFVDRFAEWYTPAVVVGALLLALLPPLLFGWAWSTSIHRALVLLVISCPCALVISTPVSIISALSTAARNGVLIKGGAHLEALGSVRTIAFDKTGTLTRGRPTVTDVIAFDDLSENELLTLVAAVERLSEHPLAAAIVRDADTRGLARRGATEFEALTGRGAQALVAGQRIRVGNAALISTLDPAQSDTLTLLEEQGKSVMIAERDGQTIGLIAVADEVRPEAAQAIATLRRLGIVRTVMLTGDNERTARAVAAQVGVDEVRAGLLPHEKVEAVRALQAEWGSVAMVGDGVNDAPALAAATVGIAMGAAGTDQALEVADVALMADDLTKLPFALALSRAANRTIRHNITFSIVVKLIFMLLAIPGWTTLWMAVFADDGASLLVTGNGLRLTRYRSEL
nr:cadmium-translocating P-type ATPase [Ardenticatenales bacterium]